MRANIINIDGNDANCGQFSMVDGVLYNGTFKIGFDEQQLLDLSALLSWWRHGLCEQEEAEPFHSMSQARRVTTQQKGKLDELKAENANLLKDCFNYLESISRIKSELEIARDKNAELQTKWDLQKETIAGLQKQLDEAVMRELAHKEKWSKYPEAPAPKDVTNE